jgi:hypothetical protein
LSSCRSRRSRSPGLPAADRNNSSQVVELQGRKGRGRLGAARRPRHQNELEVVLGQKRFFDRSQFETDLKRLSAFYSDRGYPHARISSFDVKLARSRMPWTSR